MAAGSASRVLRSPGRIVVAPTSLAAAYPYGGTEVGRVRAVSLLTLGKSLRIESEALGEATDILESPNRWVLSFFLRGWDDDAVQQFLAGGQAAGSATQHRTFSVPGSATPGGSAMSRALKILFVPDDPVKSPALIVYSGVPDWSDNAELAWQRQVEFGIPLTVDCMRDASDRILSIGMLEDLSL